MSAPTDKHRTPLYRFLAPRYWLLWLGLGLMRLVTLLPFGLQIRIGELSGSLLGPFLRGRRRIAARNIELCFPDWSQSERERLLREHLKSLGVAVVETALSWWAPPRKLRALAQPQGLEHLEEALARGQGAILLAAHFTVLEMGARLLTLYTRLHVMYRRHRHPLFEEIMRRSRQRSAERAIRKDEVRELVRSLRDNKAIWYAPDQAHRGQSSELVPFFSIPAATNVATSRLAKISGAPVLPYFPERLPEGSGYRMRIGPPLEDFPSDDPVADTARFNRLIEDQVRRVPAQYLWIHRRFKTNSPAYPDPYEGLN